MNTISNNQFDEERALYSSKGLVIDGCRFDGPKDGESALKESSDVSVRNSYFNLRYPFWHDNNLKIDSCELTVNCRAALWYSQSIEITDTALHGIKALRECRNVHIKGCDIVSPEFGWSITDMTMEDSVAQSEYFMMRSENLHFKNVRFTGKYSFQYVKNAVFENCIFDTKDAFWHSVNVTVRNCVINGEYLGWYSENLVFENCKIKGTQPLCYCRGLKIKDCEMLDADLCFEKSEVEATITTPLLSVKNPLSGSIEAVSVLEIIRDDPNSKAKIIESAI